MERIAWRNPRGAARVEQPPWSGPCGAPTYVWAMSVDDVHVGWLIEIVDLSAGLTVSDLIAMDLIAMDLIE